MLLCLILGVFSAVDPKRTIQSGGFFPVPEVSYHQMVER